MTKRLKHTYEKLSLIEYFLIIYSIQILVEPYKKASTSTHSQTHTQTHYLKRYLTDICIHAAFFLKHIRTYTYTQSVVYIPHGSWCRTRCIVCLFVDCGDKLLRKGLMVYRTLLSACLATWMLFLINPPRKRSWFLKMNE